MIETDGHGQPLEVDDLEGDWLLDFAHEAEAESRKAERRRMRVVLRWCETHVAVDDDHRLSWGEQERVWDCDAWIGGEGVPAVAEFSAEPLAAAMRMSPAATTALMAEALELRHRLPQIHARVERLDTTLWRARRVAKATQNLSPEAAAHVDAVLAPIVDSVGATRIDRAVAEAVALFAPETLEEAEESQTRSWGVSLQHHRPDTSVSGQWGGTSWLSITGDTPTLQRLHDLILDTTQPATGPDAELDLGLGVRQIQALGAVLDGLGVPRPQVRLNIDISAEDLTDHDSTDSAGGVGRVRGLGPATLAKIREWLDSASVTVLPVLDMARTDSVDVHDPPRWMRELVTRRDTHCVFPFCDVPASRCDLDHIEPYVHPDDGGPPGQTHPGNLAPACRHHHRAKTTDAWTYERTEHGDYLWRDAHGRSYAVTRHGTLELGS